MSKKLSLNRITITNLKSEEMISLQGGDVVSEWCTRPGQICSFDGSCDYKCHLQIDVVYMD